MYPFAHLGTDDPDTMLAVVGGHRPPRPTNYCTIPDSLWELIVTCWDETPEVRPPAALVVVKMEAIETAYRAAMDASETELKC